jgi:hypothetical protein
MSETEDIDAPGSPEAHRSSTAAAMRSLGAAPVEAARGLRKVLWWCVRCEPSSFDWRTQILAFRLRHAHVLAALLPASRRHCASAHCPYRHTMLMLVVVSAARLAMQDPNADTEWNDILRAKGEALV